MHNFHVHRFIFYKLKKFNHFYIVMKKILLFFYNIFKYISNNVCVYVCVTLHHKENNNRSTDILSLHVKIFLDLIFPSTVRSIICWKFEYPIGFI